MKYKKLIEATEEFVSEQDLLRAKLKPLEPVLDKFGLTIDSIIGGVSKSRNSDGIEYLDIGSNPNFGSYYFNEHCGKLYPFILPSKAQNIRVLDDLTHSASCSIFNFVIYLTEQPYIKINLKIYYKDMIGGHDRFINGNLLDYHANNAEFLSSLKVLNRVKLYSAFDSFTKTLKLYPDYTLEPSPRPQSFEDFIKDPQYYAIEKYVKKETQTSTNSSILDFLQAENKAILYAARHDGVIHVRVSSEIENHLNVNCLEDLEVVKKYSEPYYNEVTNIGKILRTKWDSNKVSASPSDFDRVKLKDII